ncbi:UDP-N-acetylglucosamine 2-epimerase [Spirosoma sp. SC4-14]|uniref:UDP-N-acetylglucosamine 2-epimerase n=1 Tax=Spirosoma sp. SC4-14 TaxID=3128900 RepID=UPI0030CBCC24
MKIGVLTSSRADYSIYRPLLQAMQADGAFDLSVLAFGSHVSQQYGYTVQHIEADGFRVSHKIESLILGDSPEAIATAMGVTQVRFASVWAQETFDLLFTLGDRYEMFAAAASSIPFTIPIAHISGGETTLGAIDNIFRHSLTMMASLHFTSTEAYRQKVCQMLGHETGVYNVGALSIDNLKNLPLYSSEQFKTVFGIDLELPTVLITFHPETVSFTQNEHYITELIAALAVICSTYQLVITMPNADTSGNMIRQRLTAFIEKHETVHGVESLGTIGYLSCMKHCRFMLGNTSSGFVEASFFPKYVINLGNRQDGRLLTPNILNCPVETQAILNAVQTVENAEKPAPVELYGTGDAAQQIVSILKEVRGRL